MFRFLRHQGLRCRRHVAAPQLLRRHRRARQDGRRRHIRWICGQSVETLFTDESRFLLHFNDGRTRVSRRQRKSFVDVNVDKPLPFGGGSVMVWAGISMNRRILPYVINRYVSGLCYLGEIFLTLVIPLLQRIELRATTTQDIIVPE